MVELKGITVPVIIVKIKEKISVDELKKELKSKLKNNLLKSSYFILESNSVLSPEEKLEIERYLNELNLKSVVEVKTKKIKNDRLLVVENHLRSGQKIEHNGDVLILGDVNRDAEVVATGNIIVTGTLRGIAHAGILGDESAVVVAYRMEPQRIGIGSVIAIVSDSEKVSPGYPEVARVENGKIVLDRV